ncbi:MAG: hypothetical protein JWM95_3346 [Gemmatimonadetes bacterium]|nr:hypothetical protein [Gemmatimonadota bacterium]
MAKVPVFRQSRNDRISYHSTTGGCAAELAMVEMILTGRRAKVSYLFMATMIATVDAMIWATVPVRAM